MDNQKDFVIENGVLMAYNGEQGEVIIPDGITHIGENAFRGNRAVQIIRVPSGCVSIEDDAFSYCEELREIELPGTLERIGYEAFFQCKKLANISIPASVTVIEKKAFMLCNSLTEVLIPEGVTEICADAFAWCKNVRKISIPKSLTKMRSAFSQSDIQEVHIADLESWLKIDAFNGLGDNSIMYINGEEVRDIVVPEGIECIRYGAFSGFTNIRSVQLPGTIKKIAGFANCVNLVSVNIPDSVQVIQNMTFAGCSSLESVDLPASVTELGRGAFENCSGLQRITIPGAIDSLERTFKNCSALISIQLPEGVERISDEAFANCAALETVNIPASVECVYTGSFAGCTSLRRITIGGNPKCIENDAFKGCKAIKEIWIPRNRVNQAKQVFKNKGKLFDLEGKPIEDKTSKKTQASKSAGQNNPMLTEIDKTIKLSKLNAWAVKKGISYSSLDRVKSLETGKRVPREVVLFVMYSYMSQMPKAPAYNKDTYKTDVVDVSIVKEADEIAAKLDKPTLLKALSDACPGIQVDIVGDRNSSDVVRIPLGKPFDETSVHDGAFQVKMKPVDVERALPYCRYADGTGITAIASTVRVLMKEWSRAGRQAAIALLDSVERNKRSRVFRKEAGVS